ncbi:helix-turn-helix domain-containing protein [Streptomyces sp. NPDC017254]|uniref:helix-turn-helix domain-containing protein n=1 Tax=unclassified Streptomyces TaxID=2593676 RepID=UPI0037BAE013
MRRFWIMQWSEYTTSERLKALRGGMTQEQLAEAAGVSVGVVRKLERGGTASLPSLLSIADALGTDIAVLLGQVRRCGSGRAGGRRRRPDRHLPDRRHGRQRPRLPRPRVCGADVRPPDRRAGR